MIIKFAHQLTEDIFLGRVTGASRKFPKDIWPVAERKLQYLNAASKLDDLRSPPGNRLEALKGDLKGYYSVRINAQWRIIFTWQENPSNVKIIDYHR